MGRIAVVSFLLLLSLAGCSTTRESEPARTATEQLLISTAVDRALDRMNLKIPEGTKIWVDAENFEGYAQKYAVGAIRDRLMREGGRLVADRAQADAVVEVRAGALSTNSSSMLIGIPSMDLPIPLAGQAKTPELSLAKKSRDEGAAKDRHHGLRRQDRGARILHAGGADLRLLQSHALGRAVALRLDQQRRHGAAGPGKVAVFKVGSVKCRRKSRRFRPSICAAFPAIRICYQRFTFCRQNARRRGDRP